MLLVDFPSWTNGRATLPESVLHRIAAGDQQAVRECLDRYGSLVWSIARRLLSSLSEAEDAVQEIFVDVWRNASRFDPEKASETTFVTMIARRRLIDRRRREQRRPEEHGLPVTLASPAPSATEKAELNDEASHAAEALRELRDDQRLVLELSIYHGLSHDEIAKKTNIPLGTVKTHIRRGLMRVRELLGNRPRMEGLKPSQAVPSKSASATGIVGGDYE
ncbi:MAG: RNA polymerase sigma factor [Gemmataceae bacterium]